MASEKPIVVFDSENVFILQQGMNIYVKTADICSLLGVSNQWIGQLVSQGTLNKVPTDYGKLFNVSYMLQKDTIKKRLDSGISYTEFSYTILQAIDWLFLYRRHHCQIQIGGSDQWGNLTTGLELIRKEEGETAKVFGITSPLMAAKYVPSLSCTQSNRPRTSSSSAVYTLENSVFPYSSITTSFFPLSVPLRPAKPFPQGPR